MKSIDFKSLLIGILGTLLVIACTGTIRSIKPTPANLGRYAPACNSTKCAVLDTQSGQFIGNVYMGAIERNSGIVHNSVWVN